MNGQVDRIREILRRESRPLTKAEITELLVKSGWHSEAYDMSTSVSVSLLNATDIVTIARNRWILLTHDYDPQVLKGALPEKKNSRLHLIDPAVVEASRIRMRKRTAAKKASLREAHMKAKELRA